jgi:hypothetical protein
VAVIFEIIRFQAARHAGPAVEEEDLHDARTRFGLPTCWNNYSRARRSNDQ